MRGGLLSMQSRLDSTFQNEQSNAITADHKTRGVYLMKQKGAFIMSLFYAYSKKTHGNALILNFTL